MSELQNSREQMLCDALQKLQAAIQLLDTASAPAQIAAHVDLAAHQLQSLLAPTEAIKVEGRPVAH